MPISQRRLDKLVDRVAGQRYDAMEIRFQRMLTAYYQAQQAFSSAQRESARLRGVIASKQQVIAELLPYYPHPLTPELRYKIDL